MKYFYSHLIKIEEVYVHLDNLNLNEDQKMHLAGLIDSTLHYSVLDLILTKLSIEDKHTFLLQVIEDPQDMQLLEFLKQRVENLEEEIEDSMDNLKKELIDDIKEALVLGGKND